ncbi:hypothetical protein [Variovorax sp. DT-64]|uniref:hypothetical protein n=1 Tax=Variovorax sp. DT-64 TaxID=3396160 RepID=UPI003F1B30C4
MLDFVTLGPQGSNHHLVTQRYLRFHGLQEQGSIDLAEDFEDAAARVLDRRCDFLVQCAVHPATMATVARYREGLYVVDTFISPSRDLAVIRDRRVTEPRGLALMAPTEGYVTPGRWGAVTYMPTVMAVADGLRDGSVSRGLTYAFLAEEEPWRFVVEEFIGSVDDAWIVYGRERVSDGSIVAWPGSPAATMYRRLQAGEGSR